MSQFNLYNCSRLLVFGGARKSRIMPCEQTSQTACTSNRTLQVSSTNMIDHDCILQWNSDIPSTYYIFLLAQRSYEWSSSSFALLQFWQSTHTHTQQPYVHALVWQLTADVTQPTVQLSHLFVTPSCCQAGHEVWSATKGLLFWVMGKARFQ